MTDFQDRVVEEKTQLDEKISKLHDFILTSPIWNSLPADEQIRMYDQLAAMRGYSEILGARIAAFVVTQSV